MNEKDAISIYKKALEDIVKYGEYPHNKKDDGCCPYGCDCPYIAKTALEEVKDFDRLEKRKFI